jgi:hypothetical protein
MLIYQGLSEYLDIDEYEQTVDSRLSSVIMNTQRFGGLSGSSSTGTLMPPEFSSHGEKRLFAVCPVYWGS